MVNDEASVFCYAQKPMNDLSVPPPVSSLYQDALRRLVGLADYERVAGTGTPLIKQDLDRMHEFARRMGDPQRAVPVIHVAGTKGKGSTAAMISSILFAAGHRVGLFTSPHLHSFRERLRVNGVPLSEERFINAVNRVWPHVMAMGTSSAGDVPTTFELLTAMAFDLPLSEKVDVLVLEVGMGGRLDSTNVADATVDVITSVSLDHTAILGNTIELITSEKAGVIKASTPTVLAPQAFDIARDVIKERTRLMGAPLIEIGKEVSFHVLNYDLSGQTVGVDTQRGHYEFRLPLLGSHQAGNAAAAIAAIEAFDAGIKPELIASGLTNVQWDGRFQVLSSKSPALIVDGAHNPQSMGVLRETISDYLRLPGPSSKESSEKDAGTVVVFGCSGDKELLGMVEQLASFATHVVVCTSRHPRSVTVGRLASVFEAAGVSVSASGTVSEALEFARMAVNPKGAIVITGSLFVVAEALEAWHGIEPERYPDLERPVAGRVEPVLGAG